MAQAINYALMSIPGTLLLICGALVFAEFRYQKILSRQSEDRNPFDQPRRSLEQRAREGGL